MKSSKKLSILLVDGGDRQTITLAKVYKKQGYKVTTLNNSYLDIGYASHYPDKRIIKKGIKDNIQLREKTIKQCISSGQFDVFVTTSDDTAELLSLMKKDVECDIHYTINDPDLFYLAYNKSETMRVCMDNDIPCPFTLSDFTSINDIPFQSLTYPLVLKPKMSYGAIGFRQINNEIDLVNNLTKLGPNIKNYLIQEYIPQTDIQYECAMFIDNTNTVKSSCVFSKNRWFPISGGSSTCNVTVDYPEIVDTCSRLLQTINWRGAADIDLIKDPRDGVVKVMEINPRVSGSVKLVINAGVNIAEQIIQLAMDKEVSDFNDYKRDIRLRCSQTDLLWFLYSSNRFKSIPSWFSWKHTSDQIFMLSDPLPYITFSIQSILKVKKEMEKRS